MGTADANATEGAPGDGKGSTMSPEDTATLQQALKKVSWIVLPLVMASNITLLLDRGSIAFAGPTMNEELGFGPDTFGLASGIFFVTYGLLQVPGAAAGVRLGMRWWLGLITIAWGVAASLTALINTPAQLYALRLLLGAAEASAAPCAWHIFSAFYPFDRLAKPYSTVFFCNQVAFFMAAPLAAGILQMDGVSGISGWRWLFLLEGLPSILVGAAIFAFLPSEPLAAWWLAPHQREVLHAAVHGSRADEARQKPTLKAMGAMALDTVKCIPFWIYAAAGVLWVAAAWSFHGWIPVIISNMLKGTALVDATAAGGGRDKSLRATLYSTIPYFCGAAGVLLLAWLADRQARKTLLPVGLSYMLGGALLACFGPVAAVSVPGGLAIMSAANAFAYGGTGVLVARVSGMFPPSHAAISLGILNSITAGLGGFIGPIIVGRLVAALRTFSAVGVVLGCFLIFCGGLVLAAHAVEERLGIGRGDAAGRGGRGDAGGGGSAPAPGALRAQTFSTAAATARRGAA
ncbi:MAG: major facilitator superfamily domain-containing protein [Monoraphidium minutum]|nr:MAG: major facilitator superfamily domain-containing protein [Monoraphidium minutum]